MDAGLPSESVHSLLQDSSGVLWVGTSKGLAFRSEGVLQSPPAASSLLGDAVLGLAEDGEGALWVASAKRVLRVEKAKLLGGALEESDIREYGPADGLHSDHGVRRYRSVVSDQRGRIWFSLDQGLSVVDPGRRINHAAPSILHIQTVSNENGPLEIRQPVRIPTGSQRVILGFTGLNLSAPERVRFRYKLDSFDRTWSNPTANREVVYTNLSPGAYRFRVMASNGDGVWNGGEEVVALEVEPALWQTIWFRLGSVALLLVAALAFYRVRLHELTKQLNVRFEERLMERTRIAQELHDTLLQGFLSASMQLHVATDQLPESSPVKPSLNRVLQLMSQVTEEGRNAVRGLRTPAVSLDLGNAFSRIEQELGSPEDVGFRVIVEGPAQALHPVLRDEVYRIGREAILNAFRHARAKNIEVEIQYAPRRFRVVVRDDGGGIDPDVLHSGRDGHWGLSGMRERAEKIGGRLSVWSKAEAGTEVELSVPGNLAFAASAKTPAKALEP